MSLDAPVQGRRAQLNPQLTPLSAYSKEELLAAIARARAGVGDFASDLANDPSGFGAAWATVQKQLTLEGATTTAITLAKDTFDQAFTSAPPGVDASTVLSSATQFTLIGRTIGGAVDGIEGLLQSASQGAPPPMLLEQFTGTMIGITVAAGVLTAGVGAAIVGAVTGLASILSAVGLFGSSPGIQICPGVNVSQNPDWALASPAPCNAVWGDSNAPGTPGWRHFPNPNDSADAIWFGGDASALSLGSGWKGIRVFLAPAQTGTHGQTLLNVAFPTLPKIDVANNPLYAPMMQALPQPVRDFHQAFLAAWKLNMEYTLNGLNVQPDWAVLVHALRLWNQAHDGSSKFELSPITSSFLYEASLIPSAPNSMGVFNNLSIKDPLWYNVGQSLVIHTGPRRQFSGSVKNTINGMLAASGKSGLLAGSNAGSQKSSAASSAKTIMLVTGGVAAAGLLAAVLVAHKRHTSTAAVIKGAAGSTKRATVRAIDKTKRLLHHGSHRR